MSKYVEYIGYFFLFLIPFFESSQKSYGFAFLLLGSVCIGLSLVKKRITFDRLDILLLLFLVIASLSAIQSWSLSRSFIELMRYVAYFLIFLSVRRFEEGQKSFLKYFIGVSLSIYVLIYGVLTIYYTIKGPNGVAADILNFYIPLAGHNHIAGLLLLSIPVSFAILIKSIHSKNQKQAGLFTLLIMFQLIVLLLSFSRSAYVLILVYFASLFFFMISTKVRSKLLYIFIPFVIGIFLLFQFIFFYSFSKNNFLNTKGQLYKNIGNPELRFEYLNQAYQGLRTSPVLGTGLDTFIYVSFKFKSSDAYYYTVDQAHNYFIQMVTETGILGGSLFLVFMLYSVFRIFKYGYHKKDFFKWSLVMAVLLTLVNNLVDYDTQFLSIALFLFLFIAYLLPCQTSISVKKNRTINSILLLFLILLSYTSLSFLWGNFLANKIINSETPNAGKLSMFSGYILPWDASYQDKLASIYEVSGLVGKAEFYNAKARRMDGLDININGRGAALEERLNNFKKARMIYLNILRNDSLDTGSYRLFVRNFLFSANDNLNKNNYAEALSDLKTAEDFFPNLDLVSVQLATSLQRKTINQDKSVLESSIFANTEKSLFTLLSPDELRLLRKKLIDNGFDLN